MHIEVIPLQAKTLETITSETTQPYYQTIIDQPEPTPEQDI